MAGYHQTLTHLRGLRGGFEDAAKHGGDKDLYAASARIVASCITDYEGDCEGEGNNVRQKISTLSSTLNIQARTALAHAYMGKGGASEKEKKAAHRLLSLACRTTSVARSI